MGSTPGPGGPGSGEEQQLFVVWIGAVLALPSVNLCLQCRHTNGVSDCQTGIIVMFSLGY